MFRKIYIIFLAFLLNWSTSFALELVELNPTLDLSDLTLIDKPLLTPTLDQPAVTDTCSSLKEFIAKEMPREVGDQKLLERLLKVNTPNWLEKFNANKVLELINVNFEKAAAIPSGRAGKLIGEDENVMIFYNFSRNELRFINRRQLFNEKLTRAFDQEKGRLIVQELLMSLGLSEEEANLNMLSSKVLKAGIVSDLKIQPSLKNAVDVETTYFLPRMINNIPVEESFFIAGISNEGVISHFRIKWPVINMLLEEQREVLSREQLEAKIFESLAMNEVNCQKEPQILTIKLAYVPSVVADGDENDMSEENTKELVFDLKLLVRFMPNSNYEGGNVQMFELF